MLIVDLSVHGSFRDMNSCVPVLGGRSEDKIGRDFTRVWCNQNSLFIKLDVFLL